MLKIRGAYTPSLRVQTAPELEDAGIYYIHARKKKRGISDKYRNPQNSLLSAVGPSTFCRVWVSKGWNDDHRDPSWSSDHLRWYKQQNPHMNYESGKVTMKYQNSQCKVLLDLLLPLKRRDLQISGTQMHMIGWAHCMYLKIYIYTYISSLSCICSPYENCHPLSANQHVVIWYKPTSKLEGSWRSLSHVMLE